MKETLSTPKLWAQGSELGSTQKWMFPYRKIKSEDDPFPDRRQASLPDSLRLRVTGLLYFMTSRFVSIT